MVEVLQHVFAGLIPPCLLHYQFLRPRSVTNAQQNVAQRVFSQRDE